VTVQHVTLELRRSEVEACIGFYELLGFDRVEPPASLGDRAAWMQAGATQIHLMWVDEPVVAPRGHVAVVAADYEAVVGALRSAGFEVEARAAHWGAARSFVRDPAGHLVEVMAAPPTEAG
jgi:catechol 2,3-dioxygenase-like lactoylglutathione lyase family enzyme